MACSTTSFHISTSVCLCQFRTSARRLSARPLCFIPERAPHHKNARGVQQCPWNRISGSHRCLLVRAQGSQGQATSGTPKTWQQKAPAFLGVMYALGATVGPLVDGIHGQVHLVHSTCCPPFCQILTASLGIDGMGHHQRARHIRNALSYNNGSLSTIADASLGCAAAI